MGSIITTLASKTLSMKKTNVMTIDLSVPNIFVSKYLFIIATGLDKSAVGVYNGQGANVF